MAAPVCTELEVTMMDWLGKLLDLPEEFLNCSEGPGGGVLQVLLLFYKTSNIAIIACEKGQACNFLFLCSTYNTFYFCVT